MRTLSTKGDHKNLNAYANPAQLNNVIVLLLIPALTSQTDRVEKTKRIGRPEENPRQNMPNIFFLKEVYFLVLVHSRRMENQNVC